MEFLEILFVYFADHKLRKLVKFKNIFCLRKILMENRSSPSIACYDTKINETLHKNKFITISSKTATV